jgi:hypothetical protein
MPHTQAFNEMLGSLKREYLGKKVPVKYKKRYGKRYDPKDVKSFAYALAKSKGIKIDK